MTPDVWIIGGPGDHDGLGPRRHRFYLKAPNGEIIASSESYKSKAAAQQGINSVRTVARGATVVDNTD